MEALINAVDVIIDAAVVVDVAVVVDIIDVVVVVDIIDVVVVVDVPLGGVEDKVVGQGEQQREHEARNRQEQTRSG